MTIVINWSCILCTPEILCFCQINEKKSNPKGNLNKATDALVNLMNQLNTFTDDKKENELNLARKALIFFHMNVCSLTKNVDDFNILLSDLNVSFDILAMVETRIKKDSSSPFNLQLSNYSIKHIPIESSLGGTLLYISKRLSYQLSTFLSKLDQLLQRLHVQNQ